MHGFGVGASIVRRKGHLHDAAMHLRACGVAAFAPNVAPYETVRVRARQWATRFEQILEATGADRLVCIAHSMGGLDARYLISRMGWHDRIPALVTVSTPHRGTGIASFLLQQPEVVRALMASVTDWFGTHLLADGTADSVTAVRELTPEHVQAVFNPSVPDHPDVRYWSYAGRGGKNTEVLMHPFFRFLNAQLHRTEGENDGLVSVRSARWGTFMGTVEADHAQQVGLMPALNPGFDANGFYQAIVERLAKEGP
jgi:triacylglycerol lipase